jgi:hypothetical protein
MEEAPENGNESSNSAHANEIKKKTLHVSGDYRPITRRNNCVYASLGTRYFTIVG